MCPNPYSHTVCGFFSAFSFISLTIFISFARFIRLFIRSYAASTFKGKSEFFVIQKWRKRNVFKKITKSLQVFTSALQKGLGSEAFSLTNWNKFFRVSPFPNIEKSNYLVFVSYSWFWFSNIFTAMKILISFGGHLITPRYRSCVCFSHSAYTRFWLFFSLCLNDCHSWFAFGKIDSWMFYGNNKRSPIEATVCLCVWVCKMMTLLDSVCPLCQQQQQQKQPTEFQWFVFLFFLSSSSSLLCPSLNSILSLFRILCAKTRCRRAVTENRTMYKHVLYS